MPGRNQQGDYRYAYQGQEKDPETGWEAFELRMYDGRVGRWMTTDPYSQYHSPYLAMGNDPISRIDPDGGTDGQFDIMSSAVEPPNGDASWLWFRPVEVNGKYYAIAEYQNVSYTLANEYNSYNTQTPYGAPIGKDTYGFMVAGNKRTEGWAVRDPNSTVVTNSTIIAARAGSGIQRFDFALSTGTTSVNITVNYDMDNLADNLSISVVGVTRNSGNVTGIGVLNLATPAVSTDIVNLTITPLNPNPSAPVGFNPSLQSVWSITPTITVIRANVPVYSSPAARSTRPNSQPGVNAGGIKVH